MFQRKDLLKLQKNLKIIKNNYIRINKCFIEGIIVNREIENNVNELKIINEQFPNCYICNIDGNVIVE